MLSNILLWENSPVCGLTCTCPIDLNVRRHAVRDHTPRMNALSHSTKTLFSAMQVHKLKRHMRTHSHTQTHMLDMRPPMCRVGSARVFDTGLPYRALLGLLASQHQFWCSGVRVREPAPVLVFWRPHPPCIEPLTTSEQKGCTAPSKGSASERASMSLEPIASLP